VCPYLSRSKRRVKEPRKQLKMSQFQLPNGLSPEARKYALQELARRAGVAGEFFRAWNIEVQAERTVVKLSDDIPQIIFQHATEEDFARLLAGHFPVARAAWLAAPRETLLQEDIVLPFVHPSEATAPLFTRLEDGGLRCEHDLLLSTLFTLARAEELISPVSDAHGRFPAAASLATQHGFLERPIVDEYGLAFAQILKVLLPSWQPALMSLRINLTHDIDTVGIPLQLRTAVAHTIKRRQPAATLRDLISCFTHEEGTELRLVRALARISKSRGLQSSFFWKASPPGPHDSGYDPMHPKVQRVIDDLRSQGFVLGVHPGYDTFGDPARLRQEVAVLRQALGSDRLGGRQHYLRWSPRTWLDWESCGLVYDSSLGFADAIGFRAGTSHPFRPWSFQENRELDLIEVPLVVMDCTPVKYMGLARREGLERIRACLQRTELVGGVFTLLWHNVPLIEPEYTGWYEAVLDMIPAGAKKFAVPDWPKILW